MPKHLDPGPFLVFLAAMLWATDAPFRVALLQDLPPQTIVLGEHLVNALLLLPVIVLRRRAIAALPARAWGALAFIGIGGSALATVAFTASFTFVNPSIAILLQKLQPFIAIALAHGMLGERLGKRFWLWAVLAVAAAYVLNFPGLVPQTYPGETFNPHVVGALLALGAALLWGACTVLGKYALRGADFVTVTALRFWIATAFLLCWNAVEPALLPPAAEGATGVLEFLRQSFGGGFAQLLQVPAGDWGRIVVIALVSGAASLLLYYRGLRTAPASVATVAELGFPLAAVLVNAVTLQAFLGPVQIVAMIALLLCVLALSADAHARATRDA